MGQVKLVPPKVGPGEGEEEGRKEGSFEGIARPAPLGTS